LLFNRVRPELRGLCVCENNAASSPVDQQQAGTKRRLLLLKQHQLRFGIQVGFRRIRPLMVDTAAGRDGYRS